MNRSRQKTELFLTYLGLGIILIWSFFPIYWTIITSIKSPVDVFKPVAIPFMQFSPTLENWHREVYTKWRELSRGIYNSIIVASGTTILATFLGVLAGYGLARFRFRRWKNRDMAVFILAQRVLPPVVLVIPYFLMVNKLNLIDHPLGLIIAHTLFFLPYPALIMRDTFSGIDKAIDEAALVDGCSRWGAFLRIVLPLAMPGLVASALLCFAFSWNEFLFALALTYRNMTMPVEIATASFISYGIMFWVTSTRGLIAIIPPIILALLVQRYIVKGLTFGAVKG
jgi:multiple sugar transport system permease protein